MNARLCIATSLLLAPSVPLWAQASEQPPVVFPAFHVTASRLDPHAEDTAGSTTRIDRAQIERQNPLSTADLLRTVAGVHVQESAGLAVVHLRGADPNLTLVFVDGVQMNDPTDSRGGAFDLGSIDPAEIESIHIVRGPASAVHGSDALAGVIDIRTRRQGGPWVQLESAGSDGSRLAVGSDIQRSQWSVGGQFNLHDEQQERAESDEDGIAAALHAALTSKASELRWNARYAQEDSRHYPQGSGGPELAVLQAREHEENASWQFGLAAAHQLRPSLNLALDASYSDATRDTDSPGIWLDATTPLQPPSQLQDEMQRGRIGVTLRGQRDEFQSALGGEVRFEDGSSTGSIDFVGPTDFAQDRRIGSLFGEFLQNFERGVTLQAALRLDASQSERPEWSPRVSLQVRLPHEARIKSSYGRAFKLPSFYALSHPLIGDPDLAPERSESFDLGVIQPLSSRLDVEFTVFISRFEDLVDYDPSAQPPYGRMVNRDQVTSQGFEALARLDLPKRVELIAMWSRAKTEVEETGDPLNERPEWLADVALSHRFAAEHALELRWRYVGAIPSFSYPTGLSEVNAYGRLDLNLQLHISEQLRATVAVENLTDVDYYEALGVPGSGILPRLGIFAEF